MENNEQVNSDVQVEVSSEPQTQSVETSGEAVEAAKPVSDNETKPFHEHPRFQELISQKNELLERVRLQDERTRWMESQLAQLNAPKQTAPVKPAVLDRLKQIDPEFAELIEAQYSKTQSIEALQKRIDDLTAYQQQTQAREARNQALTQVSSLHDQFKVPKELRDYYEAKLRTAAADNPKLGLQDLPGLYKSVHEGMTKFLDSVKRAERESYVSSKKADASIPTSQPKGTAVTKGNKTEFSKDPAEARQQMVKMVLEQARQNKTI